MSVTILVPRARWSLWDQLRAQLHPGRPATLSAPSYLDELMARRFECLILCQPCVWKATTALQRSGYRKDPEMRIAANRCDGCRREYDFLGCWFAEESFGALRVTRDQLTAEARMRRA